MSKLVLICAALAACSDPYKKIERPVVATVPADAAVAPIVLHAPPTCPLPPLVVEVDPDARPIVEVDPDESPEDAEARRERRSKPLGKGAAARCEVADSNLARVEQAILAGPTKTAAIAVKPWDKKTAPVSFALVNRRLALQPEEIGLLDRNGFVVLSRFTGGYGELFHEIYQSQLPIYVSVDAVLHAIYIGNDGLIAELEDRKLAPLVSRVIDTLACALPSAGTDYPDDARRDLDLYVTVARALLRGAPAASMYGDPTVEAEAQKLVDRAIAATEMAKVTIFGRERVIDFTAYTPRSHYAKTDARKRFFRAGMWLSRIEFNLVSRSSRSSQPGEVANPVETPREDILALALADLVKRSGAADDVANLDTAWTLLAGRREDVSVAQLAELRAAAGIAKLTDPDAAAKLRAAIGTKFQRTARLHYMPQGSPDLPAIATLLGPRVVPDAQATRPIVADEVANREVLRAADMAYAMGHDRALDHLTAERAEFPTLDKQLKVARSIMMTTPRGKDDLYSAWLDAVVNLSTQDAGVLPSYTQTPAYADLRIDSALTALGHIRHNYVLVAGESYSAGGCEIPDGYVEPATKTYEALLDYVARTERAWPKLDPKDEIGGLAYMKNLRRVLETLLAIQRDELAGRALSLEQREFLSMVVEMSPATTGSPPTFTGWWFDMFRQRESDGLAPADYISSFFTGKQIAYIGATAPRLGVFVVDTGGPPRLVVGPVARGYEHQGPQARRLSDEDARGLTDAERLEPWAASYTAGKPAEPKFYVQYSPERVGKFTIAELQTKDALGPVTIELVDHHRVPLGRVTKTVKPGKTKFELPIKKGTEGIHIIVGKFHAWEGVGIVEASASGSYGGFEPSFN